MSVTNVNACFCVRLAPGYVKDVALYSSEAHFIHVKYAISWIILLVSWGGVILSPHGTPASIWFMVPAPDDR
jgi:hypothetical protein